MLSILIDRCQVFDAIQLRIRSVAIYMLFRYVNLTYEQTEELLSKISLASARNCSQWVNTIIDEDDLCVILRDKRSIFHFIKNFLN